MILESKMAEERFMRVAIDKAEEGIAKDQEPFGACIVKEGKIISVAHNTALSDPDVGSSTRESIIEIEAGFLKDECLEMLLKARGLN